MGLLVIIVIVVLLIRLSDNKPRPVGTVASNPSDSDRKLVESRESLLEAKRDAAKQMAMVSALKTTIQRLEAQIASERDSYSSKLEVSARQARISEDRAASLLNDNELLKKELAAANEKQRMQAPMTAAVPPKQASEYTHRVSGLRPGDTLNARAGPSVQQQTVAQLRNGVRITVTGAAVTNSPDLWLPCVITGSTPDSTTGAARPWRQNGWVNSMFVEEISPP